MYNNVNIGNTQEKARQQQQQQKNTLEKKEVSKWSRAKQYITFHLKYDLNAC